MSEVLPTRIRARAVGLCTMILWIAVYTGTHAFPILIEFSEGLMGSAAGVFWIFNVSCACAFLFGLKLLPETKGQTLEQIAQRWDRRLQS